MHRSLVFVVAALATVPSILARPNNGTFCSSLRSSITQKSDQSAATEFCKTWLGIPTATVTSFNATATDTVTSTISVGNGTVVATGTGFNVTSLFNVTATATSVVTAFTTVTNGSITVTETVAATCGTPGAALRKRHHRGRKPSCFNGFDGNALSSGCSCLSIPTPTSTVFASTATTVTQVVTIFTQATRTSFPTAYFNTTSTVPATATSTTTVTTFTQGTVTVSSTTLGPIPTFSILVSGSGSNLTDGTHGSISMDPRRNGDEVFFSSNATTALFSLDSSGNLTVATGPDTGFIGNQNVGTLSDPIYFNTRESIDANPFAPIKCAIVPNANASTCALNCNFGAGTTNSICDDNIWNLGQAASPGCQVFTPLAVAV